MLRKTILALAASLTLGAAALAPSSASAYWHGGWHGGWGWHHGWGWGGPVVVAGPAFYGYGGCMVRRWVYTPFGPRVRWVNRCY